MPVLDLLHGHAEVQHNHSINLFFLIIMLMLMPVLGFKRAHVALLHGRASS